MKTIDKAVQDWEKINKTAEEIRTMEYSPIRKEYRLRELANELKNFRFKYGICYDPTIKPNERIING